MPSLHDKRPFRPWLLELILSDKDPTRAHVVRVLKVKAMKHPVLGEDATVKEVSDGDVSINAVFTSQALAELEKQFEEEGDEPESWDRSTIIIQRYSLRHLRHYDQDQCEFVIYVDKFGLWSVDTGFEPKTLPTFCMSIDAVRDRSREIFMENTDQSLSSIPLSQLLAHLGSQISQDSSIQDITVLEVRSCGEKLNQSDAEKAQDGHSGDQSQVTYVVVKDSEQHDSQSDAAKAQKDDSQSEVAVASFPTEQEQQPSTSGINQQKRRKSPLPKLEDVKMADADFVIPAEQKHLLDTLAEWTISGSAVSRRTARMLKRSFTSPRRRPQPVSLPHHQSAPPVGPFSDVTIGDEELAAAAADVSKQGARKNKQASGGSSGVNMVKNSSKDRLKSSGTSVENSSSSGRRKSETEFPWLSTSTLEHEPPKSTSTQKSQPREDLESLNLSMDEEEEEERGRTVSHTRQSSSGAKSREEKSSGGGSSPLFGSRPSPPGVSSGGGDLENTSPPDRRTSDSSPLFVRNSPPAGSSNNDHRFQRWTCQTPESEDMGDSPGSQERSGRRSSLKVITISDVDSEEQRLEDLARRSMDPTDPSLDRSSDLVNASSCVEKEGIHPAQRGKMLDRKNSGRGGKRSREDHRLEKLARRGRLEASEVEESCRLSGLSSGVRSPPDRAARKKSDEQDRVSQAADSTTGHRNGSSKKTSPFSISHFYPKSTSQKKRKQDEVITNKNSKSSRGSKGKRKLFNMDTVLEAVELNNTKEAERGKTSDSEDSLVILDSGSDTSPSLIRRSHRPQDSTTKPQNVTAISSSGGSSGNSSNGSSRAPTINRLYRGGVLVKKSGGKRITPRPMKSSNISTNSLPCNQEARRIGHSTKNSSGHRRNPDIISQRSDNFLQQSPIQQALLDLLRRESLLPNFPDIQISAESRTIAMDVLENDNV